MRLGLYNPPSRYARSPVITFSWLVEGQEDAGITSNATVQARVSNLSERSEVAGVFGISYVTYQGVSNQVEDRSNQFANFLVSRKYEKVNLSGQVSATRDSLFRTSRVLTNNFQIDPLPGADNIIDEVGEEFEVTESSIRRQLDRIRVSASPQASFVINERTNATIRYNYYGIVYDDEDEAALIGAQETTNQTVGLSLRTESFRAN